MYILLITENYYLLLLKKRMFLVRSPHVMTMASSPCPIVLIVVGSPSLKTFEIGVSLKTMCKL